LRLTISNGNPADTGSPYDVRTTPAAAEESAHLLRPVALSAGSCYVARPRSSWVGRQKPLVRWWAAARGGIAP